MPSTANKGLEVQTTGSNSGTWGQVLNDNVISYIDRMIGGTLALSLTNVNVDLTTDQARDLTIRCTGTLTGNVVITTPGIGFYFIENATTGAFTVTLRFTGGVGGTVVVPQGFRIPVVVDSTNGVRDATGVIAGPTTRQALSDALSIKGTDVASAGTIDLENATGSLVDVTGTTTITAITLSEGHRRLVRFTGILTLTNGASLVLPGGANIVTAAGDYAVFVGYAAGVVRCAGYQRAAAAPWDGSIPVATQGDMEAASSVTKASTPGRQQFHPLHPKFFAMATVDGAGVPTLRASSNVTSITDTGPGQLTVTIATDFASAFWDCLALCGKVGSDYRTVSPDTLTGGTVLLSSGSVSSNFDPASWHVAGLGSQS